ncbi:MAG: glycosyltransferase family 4 protein [Deltaproteobacteria bacterium]|nr:glycosyltransferase family 4 protein [Deltaproteobacteria bacterium]
MRIGINALYLLPGKVGGSEIYIRNLVKWLPRAESQNQYVIFTNRESAGVFDDIPGRVEVVPCNLNAASRPMRILWEQLMLPGQVKRHKIDVLLSAGMTAPFLSPVPSYVVIYDLQHENQPQNFSKSYLFFLRAIISLSAKRSHGVLTLSEKSKRDIVSIYKLDPRDVGVTYLACDHKAFYRREAGEIDAVRKKHKLPERFILYIASSLPHKNYERLLEAFKKVKEKESGIKLVLIGARDYGHGVIATKIEELELIDSVVFLGWLPFEDIPLIYSASELFVFPSLHEGFGIPVLEAFATGVPVVCSNIEPVTEVAGSAALLIDPLDIDSIASGILSVINDRGLRERLKKEGLKRAKEFSWEKTARDTVSILNTFLSRRGAK